MNRVQIIESLERRRYFSPLNLSLPTAFPTGSNPSDLAAVDLTGNGITDIVTSDFNSASVAVLRGNGNGTFQAPVFYPVGDNPESLATADFNGDGIPDIVTANEGSNTISVLMGNGDGTFAQQVTYPVGLRPEAVAVADLTLNGLPDIVVANQGSNNVSVLLNNGDGTFQPAVNYFVGDQPDGLALGDLNGTGYPDIVTVNPPNNNLHVLLSNGNGTFGNELTYQTGLAARAVTIADVNSDGRPDIIATNLHSTTISVFEGLGNGTFQSQENYGTGVFPFSVTVADMNGDGRPDIITANNFDSGVGVLLHNTVGGFATSKGYRAGDGPVAVVAADLNGDGKPDLIVADFNTNSISVLMNNTVFVPLIPTTNTLTTGQNPVELNNRLKLSVQITPSVMASKHPIGVVQFFDGYRVIGIGVLSPEGVATIYTRKLPEGANTITAYYAGDGLYAGSLSAAAVMEVVVPAVEATPLVSPTISAIRLPAQYVSGQRGIADVAINDIGDGPARGTVHVQLYASLSSTFDSTAFPVAIDGNSNANINLAGGTAKVAAFSFTVPPNLEPANYTFFAALAPVSQLNADQVVSTPAAGIPTAQSVLEFGTVGKLHGYRLTRTLINGTVVTLSLSGPGTGVLTEDADGGISIALSGTNYRSNLSIQSSGVTLDGLTDAAALGTILAPTTTANGAITLTLGLRRLTLAGASDSNILITGGPDNNLSLGSLTGVSIYSAVPIQSLSVSSYTNTPADAVTTAWIGSIASAGNFGASLTINGGVGYRDLGLNSAVIGGTLEDSSWSIQKNVGTIQAGGVASGWSGSIHGTLGSFLDTGDFAGDLAAHGIGSIRILGSLNGADLLAGADFGADARLGNDDDSFGSGILTSLVVNGSVTNSFVAAGISPGGDSLSNPGATLLRRSAIDSVTVLGTVDSASRFLSATLPSKVSIDDSLISPVGDPNFTL